MSLIGKLKALLVGSWAGVGAVGESSGEGPGPDITCEQALMLVQDFLDGELEDVRQAEVKAHFDVCERCYPHLKLESAFRDAVSRATAGQTAPPELKSKLMELMAQAGE